MLLLLGRRKPPVQLVGSSASSELSSQLGKPTVAAQVAIEVPLVVEGGSDQALAGLHPTVVSTTWVVLTNCPENRVPTQRNKIPGNLIYMTRPFPGCSWEQVSERVSAGIAVSLLDRVGEWELGIWVGVLYIWVSGLERRGDGRWQSLAGLPAPLGAGLNTRNI